MVVIEVIRTGFNRVCAINFAWEFEGVYFERSWQNSALIFEMLPMLIDYRILWLGNTVEMAGSDINILHSSNQNNLKNSILSPKKCESPDGPGNVATWDCDCDVESLRLDIDNFRARILAAALRDLTEPFSGDRFRRRCRVKKNTTALQRKLSPTLSTTIWWRVVL